jgi:arginine utilization protein RocB
MEANAAREIYAIIKEDPYFQQHPDQCGLYDGDDFLGRPVVWALKKGTSRKTLVFSGHYDCVGLENYGDLAPLALDPDALMAAMAQKTDLPADVAADLKSGDYLFGRGSGDMKSGDALNLQALLEYEPGALNILLTAVSDEENLSAGARQAVRLYEKLAQDFDLDYTFAVVSEGNHLRPDEPQGVYCGSEGKVMPVVVARGLLAHGSYAMEGLNSATIIARVADLVELAPELVSIDKGVNTQPPAVQLIRDMKFLYDVSLPEYSACAFNLTFFQSDKPLDMIETIRGMCETALRQSIDKYTSVYKQLAAKGLLKPELMQSFQPQAILSHDLEALAAQRPGYAAFKVKLKEELDAAVLAGETLQTATMRYLQRMMDFAAVPAATIVIGVAPPYYPAVQSDYLGPEGRVIVDTLVAALAEVGLAAKAHSYAVAMTDLSYMSCADPAGAEAVMANIPMRGPAYDVSFEAVAKISMPTVMIGPVSLGLHQSGERVYLPDLRENVPTVFRTLIRLLNQDA